MFFKTLYIVYVAVLDMEILFDTQQLEPVVERYVIYVEWGITYVKM